MKSVLQKVGLALLTMAVCLGMYAPTVQAEEDTLSVEIPVSILLSGAAPTDETYRITLQASEDDVAFMPEGSVDGIYTMEVVGGGEFTFPEITYSKVGIYTYTVKQESGSNEFCTYDDSVFDVTVYVTNAVDKEGLEATVNAYRQGNPEEKAELGFENFYETPVQITVVKKWDDAEDTTGRPESITVKLLKDGEVYEEVVLTEEMNWTYTWEGLLGTYTWDVKEDVPKGYTESYSREDNVITITNTVALIHTGQLTWPIPVLGILGAFMIFFGGAVLLKKKDHENA